MPRALKLAIGQYSSAGRKDTNQDFHGALIPEGPLLAGKGIAVAIADGISSSSVSRVASECAVKSFLTDYYCTADAWSVKTSGQRVITATNSWLHAQSRRSRHEYDADKGYVCTLSVLVVKSASAHLFHIGDGRIFRVAGAALEQLTEDHRVVLSSRETYLGRALGAAPHVELDYRVLPVAIGDVFVMTTDGVYEYVGDDVVTAEIAAKPDDLDGAASAIAARAFANGSPDNLTVAIVRIDGLPDAEGRDAADSALQLLPAPLLQPRQIFDGYRIEREIHASSRSHIYLATDLASDSRVALKVPSIDLRDDPAYLRRFMTEEWVVRRMTVPTCSRPCRRIEHATPSTS